MNRGVPRLAALAVAAAASAVLVGGVALAGDEPSNQDGPSGEPGTATTICRGVPPQDDPGLIRCTARPGTPGAGGQAVDN